MKKERKGREVRCVCMHVIFGGKGGGGAVETSFCLDENERCRTGG